MMSLLRALEEKYRRLKWWLERLAPAQLWTAYQVRKKQVGYLDSLDCNQYEYLIVFLAPGLDVVNGGIMSISSIAEESGKILKSPKVGIFVCPLPGDKQIFEYTKFKNNIRLVEFGLLMARCRHAKKLLMHIPEYHLKKWGAGLVTGMVARYAIPDVNFNMMLQNIKVAPARGVMDELQGRGKMTITTAHKAYSGTETESTFGCPVHYLSVWISPDSYHYLGRSQKKDLIVLSPDSNPHRESVLSRIKASLPGFDFRVIKNLTYEQYKELISIAKYSITFGEGLDGYFIEPVYSGGIGAAVYNREFFTAEYSDLPFVYSSFDEMAEAFPIDVMKTCQSDEAYLEEHEKQFSVVSKNYVLEEYLGNIKTYYLKYHSDIPEITGLG
jgi:hypothetical protein